MEAEVLAHGTRLGLDGGKLIEIADRRGHRLARIAWRDGRMSSAMVWGGPGAALVVVSPALVAHPVLGDCHSLSCGALMAAIDWDAPRRIPAIDRPATIPPGAGTMILNVIARLAARAGIAALRYDGPYPTHALWSSLAQCFHSPGDVDAFVAGVPIDFTPAPFERVWQGERVSAQLRASLERVTIDGRDFAGDAGARRLVRKPDSTWAAELWIADELYTAVARFDDRGELIGGPDEPPALASGVIGRDFPAPLRDVLAELVADSAPAPLAPTIVEIIKASRLTWVDLGLDLARATPDGFALHAALWERLSPRGMARVGLALAEAIEPIARGQAAARLASSITPA